MLPGHVCLGSDAVSGRMDVCSTVQQQQSSTTPHKTLEVDMSATTRDGNVKTFNVIYINTPAFVTYSSIVVFSPVPGSFQEKPRRIFYHRTTIRWLDHPGIYRDMIRCVVEVRDARWVT